MTRRPDIMELLDQGKVWYPRADDDEDPAPARLDEMHPRHLQNLRYWLLDRASWLHQSLLRSLYGAGSFMSGEMALDSIDSEIAILEELGPQKWMRQQPLFEAIEALLAKHNGEKQDPRQLTKPERVHLRHLLREVDEVIVQAIPALDPYSGMSHLNTAQWNAQVDSLVAKLKRLRRA